VPSTPPDDAPPAFGDPARAGRAPVIGWYGDDFTGATDTLATLAQAGLRALLFLRVPGAAQRAAAGPLDAVGIAGAARAMDPARMALELEPVGAFFASIGVRVLHYKACSTFDSAPQVGNIATAIATLRPHVRSGFVPIVGGQPNIGRWCAFSTLFAAAGAGGAVHRIDRHPTMSRHPVTPMHEADLRAHLALQGLAEVAGFHCTAYAESAQAQAARLDALLGPDDAATRAVLFDIVQSADLAAVGRLIWARARTGSLLAVGASSVVQALAAHWQAARAGAAAGTAAGTPAGSASASASASGSGAPRAGAGAGAAGSAGPRPDDDAPAAEALPPPPVPRAVGPVFALAGSLSPVTARQVEAAHGYERLPVDALRLAAQDGYAADRVADAVARLRAGRHVLVATSGADNPVDTGRAADVAHATAAFVARVVSAMAPIAPLRRVGIAGGDTSTRVVQALDLWGLTYRSVLSAGVTLCGARSDDPALDGLELMLKGGQMGTDDVFRRLADGC